MSSALNDLLHYFNNANTPKATDRKKFTEKIKILLDNKEIRNKLTENTLCGKAKNSLTWNILFKLATKILNHDLKTTIALQEKGAQQHNINKKKDETICLISTILKHCSNGKASLKSSIVLRLLNQVLACRVEYEACGQELLNATFNHHLKNKQAWLDCSSEQICELLRHLTCLHREYYSGQPSPHRNTSNSIARYLYMSLRRVAAFMHRGASVPEVREAIVKTLSESLQGGINRSSSSEFEVNLTSLNVVTGAWFLDAGEVFCVVVGDRLANTMLTALCNRPSDALMRELITFFQLQVLLHDSSSTTKLDDVTKAPSRPAWMDILKLLLQTLVEHIAEHKERQKLFSSKEDCLSQNFVQLFVGVFGILMRAGEGIESDRETVANTITPVFTPSRRCGSVQPAVKKRRLEASEALTFAWLRENLAACKGTQGVVPWLRITTLALEKFSRSLQADDLSETMELLCALASNAQRPSLLRHVVLCGDSLLTALPPLHPPSIDALFLKLASILEKMLAMQQSVTETFCFLSRLLLHHPVYYKPSPELHIVFQPKTLTSSVPCLTFLHHLLDHFPFQLEAPLATRQLLLEWVFPGFEAAVNNEGDDAFEVSLDNSSSVSLCRHYDLLTHIICKLCVRTNIKKAANLPTTNSSLHRHKPPPLPPSRAHYPSTPLLPSLEHGGASTASEWLRCRRTESWPVLRDDDDDDDGGGGDDDGCGNSGGETSMGEAHRKDNDDEADDDASEDVYYDEEDDDETSKRMRCSSYVLVDLLPWRVLRFFSLQLESLKSRKIEKQDVSSYVRALALSFNLLKNIACLWPQHASLITTLQTFLTQVQCFFTHFCEHLDFLLSRSSSHDQGEIIGDIIQNMYLPLCTEKKEPDSITSISIDSSPPSDSSPLFDSFPLFDSAPPSDSSPPSDVIQRLQRLVPHEFIAIIVDWLKQRSIQQQQEEGVVDDDDDLSLSPPRNHQSQYPKHASSQYPGQYAARGGNLSSTIGGRTRESAKKEDEVSFNPNEELILNAVDFLTRNAVLFKKRREEIFKLLSDLLNSASLSFTLLLQVIHTFVTNVTSLPGRYAVKLPVKTLSDIMEVISSITENHSGNQAVVCIIISTLSALSKSLSHLLQHTLSSHSPAAAAASSPSSSSPPSPSLIPPSPEAAAASTSQSKADDSIDYILACSRQFVLIYWRAMSESACYDEHACASLAVCTARFIKCGLLPREYLCDFNNLPCTDKQNTTTTMTETDKQADTQKHTLLPFLMPLFQNHNFSIRFQFCRLFSSFFSTIDDASKHLCTLNKPQQDQLFALVYQLMQHKADAATQVHLLVFLWQRSLSLRNSAVFTLLELPLLQPDFPVACISNAFSHLARLQGEADVTSFLRRYLHYSIKLFLQRGYHVKDFPFRLMNYASFEQFFRGEASEVVAILFLGTKYHPQLDEVLGGLTEEKEVFLKEHELKILTFILPFYSLKKTCTSSSEHALKNVKRAVAAYKYFLRVSRHKEATEVAFVLEEHLLHLLYLVFSLYFEAADFDGAYSACAQVNEVNLVQPSSLFFSGEVIQAFVAYLLTSHKNHTVQNIVQLIAERQRDGLRSIVSRLTRDVITCKNLDHKAHLLSSLWHFISSILPHLPSQRHLSLPFLIQHLSVFCANLFRSTFNFVKFAKPGLRQQLCVAHMLQLSYKSFVPFIEMAATTNAHTTLQFLPCVISSLLDLCSLGGPYRSHAMPVLASLDACCQGDGSSILDPLPFNHSSFLFSSITTDDLSKRFQSFLDRASLYTISSFCNFPRKHGVQEFKAFLSHYWSHISRGVDASIHSFTDAKTKVLRYLVGQLLASHPPSFQYFSMSVRHYRRLQACIGEKHFKLHSALATCIGILAPLHQASPLTLLPIHTNSTFGDDNDVDAHDDDAPKDESSEIQQQVTDVVVKYLSAYLLDSDPEVVSAACESLKGLLSQPRFAQMLNKHFQTNPNPSVQLLLHPFFLPTPPPAPSTDLGRCLEEILNDSETWVERGCDNRDSVKEDNEEGGGGRKDECEMSTSLSQPLVLAVITSREFSNDPFYSPLLEMCAIKSGLCSHLLPALLHRVCCIDIKHTTVLSTRFNNLLNDFFHGHKPLKKRSVTDILDVLRHLRSKDHPEGKNQWDNNFWLHLDWLLVAKVALKAGFHYSSLFYAELHSLKTNSTEDVQDIWLEVYSSLSEVDSVYACSKQRLLEPHKKLRMLETEGRWHECLSLSEMLGGDASLCKLRALQKLECNQLLQSYLEGKATEESADQLQEMRFQAAWQCTKWDLSLSDTPSAGLHQLLYSAYVGLQHKNQAFTLRCIDNVSKNVMQTLVLDKREGSTMNCLSPHLSRFRVLSELQEVSSCVFNRSKSFGDIVARWKDEDLACEFDDAEMVLRQRIALASIVHSSLRNEVPAVEGRKCLDAVLYHAAVCARKAGRLEFAEAVLMKFKALASVAHQGNESHLNSSFNNSGCSVGSFMRGCVDEASGGGADDGDRGGGDGGGECDTRWVLEEALLRWQKCEADVATHLIKAVVHQEKASLLKVRGLITYGDWLVESQSDSPSNIIESCYEKAISIMTSLIPQSTVLPRKTPSDTLHSLSSGDCDLVVDAYHSLALYADAQYALKVSLWNVPPIDIDCSKSMVSHHFSDRLYDLLGEVQHMKSPEFEGRLKLMQESRGEVEKLKKLKQTNGRYFVTIEKQLRIDEAELQQMNEDRQQFLHTSLLNYLKCLHFSSKYALCAYRLTSLWFDNHTLPEVNHLIEEYLSAVPEHFFLALMYQVAARMNMQQNLFQTNLLALVERCATRHPHHVLPVVFSLANAKQGEGTRQPEMARPSDGSSSRSSSRRKQTEEEDADDEKRITAARRLIERLKQSQLQGTRGLLNAMEWLNMAYIALSFWDVSKLKGETKPIKLASNIALLNIKSVPNVHLVAVPTIALPISPNGDYSNVVHIVSFENTFQLAGGLNLPKILSCLCSDGVVRKQLVKGRDDLRQDAVMQQVFSSVNSCLKRDAEASKRNLNIRTYKVVPLSQRSGLLEWCMNTQPLGEYLCHASHGAHPRYRPNDLKPLDCRRAMIKAHSGGNDKLKLETFQRVCREFQPVMRHFFSENYRLPCQWYQRRLAYTRSVATNSIVGYIVGLGDRHIQNILIDRKTAELVHIDFGVAFEQGWNLPTPETVPFRLTRDLVDGMGVVGVEGPFRRCSEKMLLALQGCREVLQTILQVLLHDPLYDWTLSSAKAFQLQQLSKVDSHTDAVSGSSKFQERYATGDSSSRHGGNKVAERVLARVAQKLQGFEGGVQLSVQGQVSRLIQVATDERNLSKLFPGWQPFV